MDKKRLSSRVFWTSVPKIWNENLEPIRDFSAKPDLLGNFPTTNHKFTLKKSINTCLTLLGYEWKNEVEHDFTGGLSSRVFLKFARPLPNLTKLLIPQDFDVHTPGLISVKIIGSNSKYQFLNDF